MEKKWTQAQLTAIYTEKQRILVSAAAGSGKTATLIERIIRSITEKKPPMDISRILVVTFTRAAASELRVRIMKALNDAIRNDPSDSYLRRQLLLLDSADISTIDSFCLDVMRNEFQHAGNDSDFRIGDENELALLRSKAMDDAIEEVLLSEKNRDNGKIYEFFSVIGGPRRDNELSRKLLSLYGELTNVPEGIEYIKTYIEELRMDSEAGDVSSRAKDVIISDTILLFRHIVTVLEGFLEYAENDDGMKKSYGEAIIGDLDFAKSVLNACRSRDYFHTRALLKEHVYPKLAPMRSDKKTPHSERFQKERTVYRKKISELTDRYYDWAEEDIRLINRKAEDFLSVLYSVFCTYECISGERKKAKHLMEFNDLKRGVYELFIDQDGSPTQLAHEYSSKYDIIYIDEYQDVDPIQDKIFNALACESCLYTVGDIKQSIYGFRGSDPTIFGKLRRTYDPVEAADNTSFEGSASISMSNNFRCSKPIINAANHICSYLFKSTDECFGGVGYTDSDDLVFSKPDTESPSSPVELAFVPRANEEDSEEGSIYAAEVNFIAGKIRSMMLNEHKEDGSSFSLSDFAVLCDSNKQVSAVSDILSSLGIPCDEAPIENFFGSPEILLIGSLLSSIDNPLRDVPMSAILLSPLFGFSDSELAEIRSCTERTTIYEAICEYSESGFGELRAKCLESRKRLTEYARDARIKPVDEFIPYLWNRLDLNAVASFASEDGRSAEMRLSNITKLYDHALSYSAGAYRSLHDFLAYIDELIESNRFSVSVPYSPDNGDKVHILTIHKSKGLEFPVCFIFGTGFSNAGKQNENDIIFESSVGLCFNPAAEKGLVRIRSPYREAALSRQREKQRLEKIRLLYVALTRARERLIITATETKDLARVTDRLGGNSPSLFSYVDRTSPYPIIHSKLYAEWILLGEPLACSDIIIADTTENPPVTTQPHADTISKRKTEFDFSEKELFERLSYTYASEAADIPAKLAVSSLSPSVLDEDPVYGADYSDISLSFDETPFFLSDKSTSAADRGTANHLFLQFCDFDLCRRYGVDAEVRRLTNKGFILSDHAALINKKAISRFFESDLYSMISNAEDIFREQRFNIPLPAHLFSEISAFKNALRKHYILVQGVIDIIIKTSDGRIILADYKTDRIPKEIFFNDAAVRTMFNERYSSQLSYYALAIKRLFGEYPDSIVVYSLSTAKTYEIDFDPSSFI